MNWLVANAGALYVLFGIIAAALTAVWWSNRQMKYLYGACAQVGLLVLIWVLAHFVPSDRRQIEDNVHAMRDAVKAGNVDELFKYVSKDFKYETLSRETIFAQSQEMMRHARIGEIRIRKFTVMELARDKKFAKVSFDVTAWSADGERPYPFRCEASFMLEAERWLLWRLDFFRPYVDANEKVNPFPR